MTQSTTSDTTGPFAGNYGILIRIDMQEDISAATSLSLIVERPNGSVVSWTPAIADTNFLEYTTVLNDQPFVGDYKIWPKLVLVGFSGDDGSADNAPFTMVMGNPSPAAT